MSCTRYEPPHEDFNGKDIFAYVKAHTALGGGHLALFGTGNLHTWASDVDQLVSCFTDTKMIDRKCLFDDSAGRYVVTLDNGFSKVAFNMTILLFILQQSCKVCSILLKLYFRNMIIFY